jgi:hypothetical protein
LIKSSPYQGRIKEWMHEETGNAEDEKEDVIHQLELAQNLGKNVFYAFTFTNFTDKNCPVLALIPEKETC